MSSACLTECGPFANVEAMAAGFGRLLSLQGKVLKKIEGSSGDKHRLWMPERYGEFEFPGQFRGRDKRFLTRGHSRFIPL